MLLVLLNGVMLHRCAPVMERTKHQKGIARKLVTECKITDQNLRRHPVHFCYIVCSFQTPQKPRRSFCRHVYFGWVPAGEVWACDAGGAHFFIFIPQHSWRRLGRPAARCYSHHLPCERAEEHTQWYDRLCWHKAMIMTCIEVSWSPSPPALPLEALSRMHSLPRNESYTIRCCESTVFIWGEYFLWSSTERLVDAL